MKWLKGLKYIGFLILVGFLVIQCSSSPSTTDQGKKDVKDDTDYDRSNEEDKNREKALKAARDKYKGRPKCEGDEGCEEICKDIYNRRSVREDCIELAAEQVDKLEEIYETFENPSDDDLASIDSVDFETFVEIDLRPLETLVGKLSASEAKKVLTWIADDPDIAEIFQDEDDEYDLLKKLLDPLHNDVEQALNKTIGDGDSFMEKIIDNNETALDWVHNYFAEECSNDDHEEVCIFNEWYCQVGLNDDYWDNLLDSEDVEQIVDDLLDGYTISSGAPTCWTEAVADEDDADDLTAECVEKLCGKDFTPE